MTPEEKKRLRSEKAAKLAKKLLLKENNKSRQSNKPLPSPAKKEERKLSASEEALFRSPVRGSKVTQVLHPVTPKTEKTAPLPPPVKPSTPAPAPPPPQREIKEQAKTKQSLPPVARPPIPIKTGKLIDYKQSKKNPIPVGSPLPPIRIPQAKLNKIDVKEAARKDSGNRESSDKNEEKRSSWGQLKMLSRYSGTPGIVSPIARSIKEKNRKSLNQASQLAIGSGEDGMSENVKDLIETNREMITEMKTISDLLKELTKPSENKSQSIESTSVRTNS